MLAFVRDHWLQIIVGWSILAGLAWLFIYGAGKASNNRCHSVRDRRRRRLKRKLAWVCLRRAVLGSRNIWGDRLQAAADGPRDNLVASHSIARNLKSQMGPRVAHNSKAAKLV